MSAAPTPTTSAPTPAAGSANTATPGPLAGIASLKVKLGLLVVASTLAVLVVDTIGRLAGVPSLVSVPVTIAAALGVTQWLARGMVAPLREMTRAAARMADGDRGIRIEVTSRDEVGQLATSFNAMSTELAAHDERQRALIATVSHELRTPLAAQRAVLENLADGVVAPDERTLGTALAQAERLSDLVQDLLDLSRVDSGATPLHLEAINVAELLTACVAEAELRSRAVTHQVDVSPAGLTVSADPARLAQVVANLVDNADRHSPAGGLVRLNARADADTGVWVLDVTDQGPGIPAAQRDRLFERFGTASPTTGGSGLGLAIARWITELHGGHIDALDAATGAHLRVRLPLRPPATPPTQSPGVAVVSRESGSAHAPAADGMPPAAPRPPDSFGTQPSLVMIPPVPGTPRPAGAAYPTPATAQGNGTAYPTPTATLTPPPRPLGSYWPERVSTPQLAVVSAAAAIGVLAAIVLPLANGLGIAVTLVLAAGGSLAFVAARAWRSPWAMAVWALCLLGATLITLRAEPDLAILGLVMAVPLFMSAFTRARTLVGMLLSALAWVGASARGLPLLGRTVGVVAGRRNLWVLLRSGALALLAFIVFGALFASADAIVGSWLSAIVPDLRWGEITTRAFIWFFVTGLALTAAYVGLNPPRVDFTENLTVRPVARRVDWLLPAGAVLVTFVIFLAAQASALFGGHDHVLTTTGLTYAEYARAGFGQLCVVTFLTVIVLSAIRVWAPEKRAADRRLKRVVSGALLIAALLVVASALHRMALYQEAYGYTTARVFAVTVEVWLAGVLLLAGAGALGWRWRGSVRSALYAAAALTIGLTAINVDARVAELNAARYAQTGRVDVSYLQTLSRDAAPAILSSFPRDVSSCALATRGDQLRTWASWNLGWERFRGVLQVVGEPVAISGRYDGSCAEQWEQSSSGR